MVTYAASGLNTGPDLPGLAFHALFASYKSVISLHTSSSLGHIVVECHDINDMLNMLRSPKMKMTRVKGCIDMHYIRGILLLVLLSTSSADSIDNLRHSSTLNNPHQITSNWVSYPFKSGPYLPFAPPVDNPDCFNCLLPAFECQNFANCSSYSGKCICPPGFGGDDCSQPCKYLA